MLLTWIHCNTKSPLTLLHCQNSHVTTTRGESISQWSRRLKKKKQQICWLFPVPSNTFKNCLGVMLYGVTKPNMSFFNRGPSIKIVSIYSYFTANPFQLMVNSWCSCQYFGIPIVNSPQTDLPSTVLPPFKRILHFCLLNSHGWAWRSLFPLAPAYPRDE